MSIEVEMRTDINGHKEWFIKKGNTNHQTNNPTIELTNGYKEWHLNNRRHRTDGPAVEYANGDKEWYQHGQLHRTNGPAVERVNGDEEWFINGKKLINDQIEQIKAELATKK